MGKFLMLGAIIFSVGTYGVLSRRNILIMIMSLELMLAGANLSLASFALGFSDPSGHVFVLLVMGVAAAEVAVGLAILIAFYRNRRSVDSGELDLMKG
jgi:NADH-quinone oxidoreductase subunit K